MSDEIQRIDAGDIYGHDRYGRVCVSRVIEATRSFDPSDEHVDGELLVRFSERWDDRGIEPPVMHEPLDEFCDQTVHIGSVDRDG